MTYLTYEAILTCLGYIFIILVVIVIEHLMFGLHILDIINKLEERIKLLEKEDENKNE